MQVLGDFPHLRFALVEGSFLEALDLLPAELLGGSETSSPRDQGVAVDLAVRSGASSSCRTVIGVLRADSCHRLGGLLTASSETCPNLNQVDVEPNALPRLPDGFARSHSDLHQFRMPL
jgi:hypothetical protein